MRLATVVFAVCGVGAGVIAVGAQTTRLGAPLTILQTAESAAPGYDVLAGRAEFEPGAATGWHRHPGEMVGYVLDGSLVVEQQGQPAVTLAAGQAFIVPAGVAHIYTNRGTTHARMHATYVVAHGKPLSSPVVR